MELCEANLRGARQFARKAQRDYLRFLSKVEYSPDIDREDCVVVPLSTLFQDDKEQESESQSLNTERAVVKHNQVGEEEVPEAALTYHPLLPDALYSLLLAATLTLTPPHVTSSASSETPASILSKERAELARWASKVARLQQICDGYPLFLPARSPSHPPPLQSSPAYSYLPF